MFQAVHPINEKSVIKSCHFIAFRVFFFYKTARGIRHPSSAHFSTSAILNRGSSFRWVSKSLLFTFTSGFLPTGASLSISKWRLREIGVLLLHKLNRVSPVQKNKCHCHNRHNSVINRAKTGFIFGIFLLVRRRKKL